MFPITDDDTAGTVRPYRKNTDENRAILTQK